MSGTCGCFVGTAIVVSASEVNPSGPFALMYRMGTYATFLETMLARFTGIPALTTVDQADPSIALLDAWAKVADVLIFYQERIANEAYVPTAHERRSMLELARLNSYRRATATLTLDAGLFGPPNATKRLRARRSLTYQPQSDGPPNTEAIVNAKQDRVYLDIWERLITSVEDDSVREGALSGADASARPRVTWRLRATELAPPRASGEGTKTKSRINPYETARALGNLLRSTGAGRLQARRQSAHQSVHPCTLSPISLYRGPENQLYRVEIHLGGGAGADSARMATLTWSREKGAVMFPILEVSSATA